MLKFESIGVQGEGGGRRRQCEGDKEGGKEIGIGNGCKRYGCV